MVPRAPSSIHYQLHASYAHQTSLYMRSVPHDLISHITTMLYMIYHYDDITYQLEWRTYYEHQLILMSYMIYVHHLPFEWYNHIIVI
jgi:hypothetical protein